MSRPKNVVPGLTATEEHFLRRMLARVRSLESRTRGLYAESLLCELLPGATASDYAAEAHDVTWPRPDGHVITIAVRTSGSPNSDHDDDTTPQAGSWNFPPVASWIDPDSDLKRRCWADGAVLCFHDGWGLSEGWRFYVLAADEIEQYSAQRVTTANLATNGYMSVGPDELADAV